MSVVLQIDIVRPTHLKNNMFEKVKITISDAIPQCPSHNFGCFGLLQFNSWLDPQCGSANEGASDYIESKEFDQIISISINVHGEIIGCLSQTFRSVNDYSLSGDPMAEG